MRPVFISGTNTGVGKTFISRALIGLIESRGDFNIVVRKPVETGCTQKNGVLWPEDASLLNASLRLPETIDLVCSYRFSQGCSPEQAAKLSDKNLCLADLYQACDVKRGKKTILWVEGAGGLYSPIAESALNIELAARLNACIFLVAIDQLGVIGEVLAAVRAACADGASIGGVLLNQSTKTGEFLGNQAVLSCYLKGKCKVITLPHCESIEQLKLVCRQKEVAQWLLAQLNKF